MIVYISTDSFFETEGPLEYGFSQFSPEERQFDDCTSIVGRACCCQGSILPSPTKLKNRSIFRIQSGID